MYMNQADSAVKMGVIDKVFVGLLLTILGGIVLHTPLTVWLGTIWPEQALWIKAWKEVLMFVALIVGVVIIVRRSAWSRVRNRVFCSVIGFGLLTFAMLPVFYQGIEASLAGLIIDLRFFLFFVLVYAALTLYPQLRRMFIRVFMAGALVVVGFAALQVTVLPDDSLKHIGYGDTTIAPYLTVDENPDYVRINSTLRGPNPLGAYVAIILAACLALWLRGPRKIGNKDLWIVAVLIIGGAVALWASYSRSAALAALLAVGIVLIVSYGRRMSRAVWFGLAALALILGGSLVAFRDTQFVSQVILHEDPSEGNDTNSNDGHAASLADGIDRMARQPLGAGIGSTGSASLLGEEGVIIENHYLFVAHEVGWAGLLLFIYIQYVVLAQLWKRRRDWLALGIFASGVGLAVAALFLPVWTDDTVSIVWWGLAAVALAAPILKKR